MPQTTVSLRQNKWLSEGQYATTNARVIEGALENVTANVPAGQFLSYGRVAALNTATKQVAPLSGAPGAGIILVIPVLLDRYGMPLSQMAANTNPTAIGVPSGGLVDFITDGDIVMYTEEAVNIGDAVHYRHTAAAAPNDIVGRIRKSADSTNTATIATLKFAESRSSSGLVAVRVLTSIGL